MEFQGRNHDANVRYSELGRTIYRSNSLGDGLRMIFTETNLPGAFVIELQTHTDERGFFARSWCQQEFEVNGLNQMLLQCNISFNSKKGTLRGMHYQVGPFEEAKLVRCTMVQFTT